MIAKDTKIRNVIKMISQSYGISDIIIIEPIAEYLENDG